MRLPVATYRLPPNLPPYRDHGGLREWVAGCAFRANILLAGPKGIGKTLVLQHVAQELGAPWVTVDGSEDIRRSALAGTYVVRGNETPYIYGAVSTAFDIANEVGQCVLALEEINALPPAIQKMLNPVCDYRCAWDVPEAQLSFRLNKDARLWVVGTLNYRGAGGIYDLNPDLLSRFRVRALTYPGAEDEALMLLEVLNKSHQTKGKGVVKGLLTLAKETRTGQMGYELSTRDLVAVLEDFQVLGLDNALRGLVGKYDPHTQANFVQRIKSIFNRNFTA